MWALINCSSICCFKISQIRKKSVTSQSLARLQENNAKIGTKCIVVLYMQCHWLVLLLATRVA